MIYDPTIDTTKPGETDKWIDTISSIYDDESDVSPTTIFETMHHMRDAVLAEQTRARIAEAAYLVTLEMFKDGESVDDIAASMENVVASKMETFLYEPEDKCPVIDSEGFYWHYNADPDDDEFGESWVRHRYERMGTLLTGPPIGQDWSDVLNYGPIRRAAPHEDASYLTVDRKPPAPEPEPYPGLPEPDAPEGEE